MVQKDVSRQTVVVLVFLAILVTLLGTLTVISEVSKVQGGLPAQPDGRTSTTGTVGMTISDTPPGNPGASGQVMLTIAPNEG